jgi:hypothetical protein
MTADISTAIVVHCFVLLHLRTSHALHSKLAFVFSLESWIIFPWEKFPTLKPCFLTDNYVNFSSLHLGLTSNVSTIATESNRYKEHPTFTKPVLRWILWLSPKHISIHQESRLGKSHNYCWFQEQTYGNVGRFYVSQYFHFPLFMIRPTNKYQWSWWSFFVFGISQGRILEQSQLSWGVYWLYSAALGTRENAALKNSRLFPYLLVLFPAHLIHFSFR